MAITDVLLSPPIWVFDCLLDTLQFLVALLVALPVLLFELVTKGPAHLAQPLNLWRTLSPLPLGAHLFSCFVGATATYTASISPRVVSLTNRTCEVRMSERPWLRNPFSSVHAIALANLAECASGLVMLSAMPRDVRGIPTAVSVKYSKKARGVITAKCDVTLPQVEGDVDFDAVSTLTDAKGDVVAVGTVQWRLSKRPSSASASASASAAGKTADKKKK
eukprot:Opistho-1_new@98880